MLPNDDDFIDPPTIIVYLDKNLVPALLEDIISYCRKMAAYYDDEKLLMHFFQDSLMGASLEWYMQLEHTYIWTLRELDKDFS